MSDKIYNIYKSMLLTIGVIGLLLMAFQFLAVYKEATFNSRFIQYDLRKEYSPDGNTHQPGLTLLDTKTGAKYYVKDGERINTRTGKIFQNH